MITTQTEAVNNLIGAVQKFLIMSRGNMYTAEDHGQRMVLDGARDDLVGALAVLDCTFPEGEGEVPDWEDTARERLVLIQGLNALTGRQSQEITALRRVIETAHEILNDQSETQQDRIDDARQALSVPTPREGQ